MTERLPLYVYGASGHGKVVADAALASDRFAVRGFLDDDGSRHGQALLGLPVEGGLEAIQGQQGRVAVALGVGSNRARLAVLERLAAAGHSVVTVVHPSAVVATGVVLGDGTFVAPLAVVHTDARLGRACIVNSGAVVEHDNVLGDGVHVSPNAALGGNVTLGDEVHVGLGAVVLPGITVGARSVVGAGAVVIEGVPEGVTVAGMPARRLRTPRTTARRRSSE
jgi:sugar O-acyltransferase (sialic acid O-acetyltransferase NeuD family)